MVERPDMTSKFVPMGTHTTTTLLLALIAGSLSAQSNKSGTFHICAGASVGIHATHFENSYSVDIGGITISDSNSEDDAAATTTFPIELHYGIVDRFSLGLYVEPGTYLDSADNSPNSVLSVGLTPRFYIVNLDRFNWAAILDIGLTGLEISDKEETITDSYLGPHVRIGTGISFYFGEHFGIQLFTKYGAYLMKWRDREPDDFFTAGNYEAKLNTSGIHFGGGLTVKFGGN